MTAAAAVRGIREVDPSGTITIVSEEHDPPYDRPPLSKQLWTTDKTLDDIWSPAAGRNMAVAGPEEPYRELPFFYSDLFDMGYEAVGDTDSRLETVEDWTEPRRKGVVYYLKDGRVRGVLLWNVCKVDEARALIAEPGPFRAEDLEGRIRGES